MAEPDEAELIGSVTRAVCEALEPFDQPTQSRILEAVCILLGEDELATLLRVARVADQAAQRKRPRQDA